jgi:hypothetical protein
MYIKLHVTLRINMIAYIELNTLFDKLAVLYKANVKDNSYIRYQLKHRKLMRQEKGTCTFLSTTITTFLNFGLIM